MSKKLAAGSNAIVLDVKTGSGAFMKTLDDSIGLAQAMVSIGERNGRRTIALITDMDLPLGHAIGNSLEVAESVATLKGHGPADLTEVCLQLAANMLYLADKGTLDECRRLAEDALSSGAALEKLRAMVIAQGGDVSVIDDTSKFPQAPVTYEVKSPSDGYITHMETEKCGIASVALGAGRESKEDDIDMSAGVVLVKKTGDKVTRGETIARLYTAKQSALPEAERLLLDAITFSDKQPAPEKLILARVSKDSVERF